MFRDCSEIFPVPDLSADGPEHVKVSMCSDLVRSIG